jgi:hypothetical protein
VTSKLAKARLTPLKEIKGSGKDAKPSYIKLDNDAVDVQFNPTSLKLSRQNNIDKGGSTTNTQKRQSPSSQPATLTFDLELDTAEGDATGNPLDVRDLTQGIRQFVEVTKENPTDPPPPLLFAWGSFHFQGIVTQLSEDLDYFSAEGMPLRAKCSVTVTEQDPDFEAKKKGAAARNAAAATPPGGGGPKGAGPGSSPTTNPVSAALAQAGESVQQALARLNTDPATWRAAMGGLGSPLTLAAGAQLQLGAQVSAGAGIGVSAGFAAGAGVSASASLAGALGVSGGMSAGAGFGAGAGISGGAGISAGAGFSAGARFSGGAGVSGGGGFGDGGSMAAGFALAEGGGLAASANFVASTQVDLAVASARASFDLPGKPGANFAEARLSASFAALSHGVAPVIDPRSQSFGIGIPLAARAQAGAVAAASIGGTGSLQARARVEEIAFSAGASVPPWQRLPSNGARRRVDALQRSRDAGDSTMR